MPAEVKFKKSVNNISGNTTESGNIAIRAIIKRLIVFNKDIFETLVETIKQKPTNIINRDK